MRFKWTRNEARLLDQIAAPLWLSALTGPQRGSCRLARSRVTGDTRKSLFQGPSLHCIPTMHRYGRTARRRYESSSLDAKTESEREKFMNPFATANTHGKSLHLRFSGILSEGKDLNQIFPNGGPTLVQNHI
ncbi:hypothetical protein KM043_018675 [Ampulex compressa]|nr:hypothetical protein KM043_018675 [Ampulex compressa]